MSDRSKCLTVVLDKDYRVDDLDHIIGAISMLRGVVSVKADVADISTYTAYASARHDLEKKLWEALKEKK